MSAQLRLLYSSNAFWAASGYGVQGKSLLPRLAELPEFNGRESIAQFAWWGLDGGMHHVESFRIYPKFDDPYGNDVIGAHAQHFGANLVISLIDVWVMKQTAQRIAPALWCVPGDTLITLNDGHQLPIKDLYAMQGNRRAMIGHDGTRKVDGLITGYHYMGVKPTLEIETMTGRKLRTTAESGVYVKRNGDAKYIPAASVIPGDMVYCTAGNHTFIQEDNNGEFGAYTHAELAVSDRHQGNGTGVLSGNHRRRGNHQHPRPHKAASNEGAQGRTLQDTATSGAYLQHGYGVDGLALQPNRVQDEQSRPSQGAHQLSSDCFGLSNVCAADPAIVVLDFEEAISPTTNGVHRDSSVAVGYRIQPVIRAARSRDMADVTGNELEEVRSVRSTGIYEHVYDLTTSTHNFYANGMLIHNCPWLPIDHDPVPDQFLESLQGAHLPLTYAKWGHNMLTDAGVENVYIPHGIETGVYKVLPDREEVRKFKKWLTGDEETFLCAMVAANKGFPDRKWFQGQLECFRDFVVGLERQGVDTSKIKLYLHTIPNGVHGGVDFHTLANRLGIHDRLIFPHPYLYRLGYPPEHLALVYNAADVLLSVSMSEGFGIPIIEAQACGTPVIATNFSAMPELVRWGHLVDVADRVLTGMHSYHALPSKPSMVDKLNRLYEAWTVCGGEWPLSKRIATQDLIHAEYSWDTIVREQWRPLMARLAQEAPPLDARYQVGGVVVPQAPVDDVTAFVDAVNGEDKPKRRIGPFVPRIPEVNGHEPVAVTA
jgi:hypothetical protein